MLQIRLSNKGTTSESGGAKLPSGETVTVACPDHLILAELPVAKSLGSASGVTHVKTVGRRSRRPLGERVHFCVQCDFPIAIYGRLSPCEHAFCLDCARSDSICYLCDERIHKIQTIKMMEGIFICAAPHCLKSFLKKTDFESHVHTIHADLVNPNTQKDGNESEAASAKKPPSSESTVQAPTPRPGQVQVQDHEDRTQWHQPPPVRPPLMQPIPTPPRTDNTNRHPGFDGPTPTHRFPQQNLDMGSGQQQGMISETPYAEYPMNTFGQTLHGPESGMDHGSSLGYPRPWNTGPTGSTMANQGGFDQERFFQEVSPSNNSKDFNDGRGISAPPRPMPPPPLPLPQQFVHSQGGFYGGDGQGYGWQQDKHQNDGFGNRQD